MSKFKVGDKVRLVNIDGLNIRYIENLPRHVHEIATVIQKASDDGNNSTIYTLVGCGFSWYFNEDWLELAETKQNDFQTEQELWQWLVDGNTIKNDSNDELIKFINGKLMVKYNCNNNFSVCYNMEISMLENWSKYQETKWFENIPGQGILCWVWCDDEKIEDKSLEVVINHNNIENSTYPFTTLSTIYKYATPASLEEIEKYILKQ